MVYSRLYQFSKIDKSLNLKDFFLTCVKSNVGKMFAGFRILIFLFGATCSGNNNKIFEKY